MDNGEFAGNYHFKDRDRYYNEGAFKAFEPDFFLSDMLRQVSQALYAGELTISKIKKARHYLALIESTILLKEGNEVWFSWKDVADPPKD